MEKLWLLRIWGRDRDAAIDAIRQLGRPMDEAKERGRAVVRDRG